MGSLLYGATVVMPLRAESDPWMVTLSEIRDHGPLSRVPDPRPTGLETF